jgi:hypothetical protein
MHFYLIFLVVGLNCSLALAQGRSPAVEDFVGIEVETVELQPQGTESLFNFEKDIDSFNTARIEPSLKQAPGIASFQGRDSAWSTSATMGIIFVLGLPFLTWLLVMNHLRQRATRESASNIEILENYRKERQARLNKSEKSEDRKVS